MCAGKEAKASAKAPEVGRVTEGASAVPSLQMTAMQITHDETSVEYYAPVCRDRAPYETRGFTLHFCAKK
jgi:hypothetical protein